MIIMESRVFSYIASLILLWHRLPHIESSVNLALHKNTSQSSTFKNLYPSSNAVDGLNKQCVNDGFAHTLDGEYEWWQVDLGEMCEIRTIQIYYRTTILNRLDGYAIDIIKSQNPLETWQCYKDTDNTIPTYPAPSHICPSLGRYVKFSREKTMNHSNAYINLCELEVYGCPQGRYGNNSCNSNCSIGCINSRCDPGNGSCNCISGWSGDKCDQILCKADEYVHGGICKSCRTSCLNNKCKPETGECSDGCKPSHYGTSCNLNCSTDCYNTSCRRDNGECFGCKSGLYGSKCDVTCPKDCRNNVCRQDNGHCTSCNHPYKGNNCTECVDGKYGEICDKECPSNCNLTKCNRMGGFCSAGCKHKNMIGSKCEECTDGKYGENCDKECPSSCYLTKCNRMDGSCSAGCTYQNKIGSRCEVCVVGLYGKDCDVACPVNCKFRMCGGTDGTCLFGCKYANMTGIQCDGFLTATTGTDNQTNANIGLIILGIISSINTVFIIIIIIIILILYYKRRQRKETVYENQKVMGSPQTGTDQIDIHNPEQQQTVHYETLGLSDRGSINTNSADAYTGLNMIEARIHQNDNS